MKTNAFRSFVILLGITLSLSLFSASGAHPKPNSLTQTRRQAAADGPCPAVEIAPVDA